MGLGFVLLIWAVFGTVLACVGGLFMGAATALLTRRVTQGRRSTIFAAVAFPFACLGWAAALFVFQALVNSAVHHDPGLGDTWTCRVPNGYTLLMIDVTDQGWVYNPKTQGGDAVGEQEDAVSGVRVVQVSGRYILGGSDTHGFDHLGQETNTVDSYFLLDTQTGKRTGFSSQADLQHAAARFGILLSLEPILVVYSRYRYTWFDTLIGIMFLVPPLIYFLLLTRRIIRVRRSRRVVA